MFDSYQVGPSRVYHDHKTTVTENRAPTDASIKIMEEMRSKILSNIVGTLTVTSNQLETQPCVVSYAAFRQGYALHFHFILNGRKFEEEIFLQDFDMPYDLGKVADLVRDKMSERIAESLASWLTGGAVYEMNPNKARV